MSKDQIKRHEEFRLFILNPIKYKLFLINKLPMALIAGIRVIDLSKEFSKVTIPFKYLTQNPFRSIYFACLSMAAELSQGALVMSYVYKSNPAISTLPIKMEADFTKKAVGKITFECTEGERFRVAIAESLSSGQAQQVRAQSIGRDEKGDQVALFHFTWSFKAKSSSL